MLKQVTLTLDTSDPLQAQWLVEYLGSPDRARFGRACLLLGFLAASGQVPAGAPVSVAGSAASAIPPKGSPEGPRRGGGIGAGLFGME